MDLSVYPYTHGDSLLIDKIVNEFLSQGKFDKLRKECMSDADTKPAYQNLQQRVETTVSQFLKKQVWKPDLNKNQLRDSLRKHILESGFFDAGINRIVDQVVNPNVLATVFMPEVEEVVYNYLSIPKPTDKNPKTAAATNGDEKASSDRNRNDNTLLNFKDHHEKSELEENEKYKNLTNPVSGQEKNYESFSEIIKSETLDEDNLKKGEATEKKKDRLNTNIEGKTVYENANMERPEKVEIPSDESETSFSRLGIQSLQIKENEGALLPDSDDSAPLEINEKSMSDSRDSDDSIMNQMSPISQGRLTPDIMEKKEEKVEKTDKFEDKTPLTFIGRIPKIKKDESEASKFLKKEKPEMKSIYSSDESDSSKSFGKSDTEDKRVKEKQSEGTVLKDEKKIRGDSDKGEKYENVYKKKKEQNREKFRHDKERKIEKSREGHDRKKSSSSSSRERSSSRHSTHLSRHKDSKPKESEKKKKESEKKKSKAVDDHGKERNKKDDRRSTDRDSNERERDKSSRNRTQGESRKREKDQKSKDGKSEKSQKKESQTEQEVDVVTETEHKKKNKVKNPQEEKEFQGKSDSPRKCLNFKDLHCEGVLTQVFFPKLTDDFYVKFNSTGFKYFEDWEKAKLDCEEEFKEFVDEAENNLDLLSDEDSDYDIRREFNFQNENEKIIENLLIGLGNFRKSIMFDPKTSEFFSWTSSKFYQKFKRKESKEFKNLEVNKRKGIIKENADGEDSGRRSSDGEKENQGRQNKALHLKLLNKYKKQALRQRRHKKKAKRTKDFSGGIKEKNENAALTTNKRLPEEFILKTSKLPGAILKIPDKFPLGAIDSTAGSEEAKGQREEDQRIGVVSSQEDRCFFQWTESSINRENTESGSCNQVSNSSSPPRRKTDLNLTDLPEKIKCHLPLNLPLSPESDDINSNGNNNDLPAKNVTNIKHKRWCKLESVEGTPKKQKKRNCSQKYENQDLYKPRPRLNMTRTRQRDRSLEPKLLPSDSSISTTNIHVGK